MLHPTINDTTGQLWCGPAAIATITAAPISIIRKRVRRLRNDKKRKFFGAFHTAPKRKQPVKGMYMNEVVTVMARLGKPMTKRGTGKAYSSLAQFMDDLGNHSGPYVVNVTGHFVAVSHGEICDTFTKGKPVPFAEYPKPRTRIKEWARF